MIHATNNEKKIVFVFEKDKKKMKLIPLFIFKITPPE